jgi:surfeit locus 1 family protein
MQIFNYRFQPKLIPTLATLLVLPLMIYLGMWQSNKADQKQAKQALFDQRGTDGFISIGAERIDLETLRFRKVIARGYYEPAYQILLDNQVNKGQAGYHVITPLHLAGTSMRILVNRGWVPLGADRNVLPQIETPVSEVEVAGYLQDVSGRYFELARPEETKGTWNKVWQNLDLARYKKEVTFELQPALILLDPANASAGYVREWPKPDFKIDVNRGYAIQWYLMSVALIIIYFVTNLKKISPQDTSNAK